LRTLFNFLITKTKAISSTQMHFPFLKWFQWYFKHFKNHHGQQCASQVSQLKEIHYLLPLIYRPNFLIEHFQLIQVVADILCIPIWFILNLAHLLGTSGHSIYHTWPLVLLVKISPWDRPFSIRFITQH